MDGKNGKSGGLNTATTFLPIFQDQLQGFQYENEITIPTNLTINYNKMEQNVERKRKREYDEIYYYGNLTKRIYYYYQPNYCENRLSFPQV